jgi:queuine tRNA-ribosyltransferase
MLEPMTENKNKISDFSFEVIARDGSARAGILTTPHGIIHTPIFMPVGTQATVKSVTPAQLDEIGVQILLSNTYHLYLRPGAETVAEMGGLHKFMQWHKPILTDSGGFQVFSLGTLREIDEDGVTFKSHIDGSTHRFTPEFAIQIQEKLGADIIMAFDECPDPQDKSYNIQALERTHRWAERCLKAKTRADQALFGIVQGGIFPDLRKSSAEYLSSLEFPGYAIGGLSVGESKADMLATIELVNNILPQDKPRYLMGVGTPEDLVEGIFRGVDMFDCVLPTRLARHHAAQTMQGRLNLSNASYSRDERPIDMECSCYTCTHFSRAYLRHLINAREMLAATLLSIHNIHTLVELSQQTRQSIIDRKFTEFRLSVLKNMQING